MLGRTDEALSAYDRAISIEPKDADTWLRKGLALFDLERPNEAIQEYDKALGLQPDLALAWLSKGTALMAGSRYQEAIDCFDLAIQHKTDHLEAAWINKGVALRLLKRYRESIDAFAETLKVNGRSAQAWYNLGGILHTMGQVAEAERAFDNARRLGIDVDALGKI